MAHWIVDWLNSKTPPNEPGYRERIGGIIEKLNALRPPAKRFRKASGESGKVGIPQGAEYHSTGPSFVLNFQTRAAMDWGQKLHELNRSIRDCFAHPRFEYPVGDGWTVAWEADSDFGKYLAWVLYIAGLIAHVRRCANCGKWFFANRLNQTSCSKLCRNEKYAKSPKGKARTRTRMREYMAKKRREAR